MKSLRLQLLMGPTLAVALVLGVGQAETWLLASRTADNEAAEQARDDQQRDLAGIQLQLASLNAGVYRSMALMASLDEAAVKAVRDKLKTDIAPLASRVQQLQVSQADGKDTAAQLAKDLQGYLAAADNAMDMATVDPNTGVAALQSSDQKFAAAKSALTKLNELASQSASQAKTAQRQADSRLHWLLSGLGLLVAGLTVLGAWVMQRRLLKALDEAGDLATAIAGGDLAREVHTHRQDEIGRLIRAMGDMQGALRRMVSQVRESAESIQVASVEVATGNQDLSQRTEQAASNLQQTASSLEQLTGTVRQSADAAAQANQLAASASSVAQRGGAVVAQVVSTMDEINSSSKRIADIIGTIDGIAFQTNILALNAAVEAARAGEQGRGFAVVASEVRSLAQRSAGAAREIKGLIGTSVEKVESGARLVQEAGSTMGEIVASVQRVTDIIGEITAAASEQSTGIGQVNGAVTSLDQMTQQNAALVEESAAAAESLKEQAQRLLQSMQVFRVTPAGHAGAARAAQPGSALAQAATPARVHGRAHPPATTAGQGSARTAAGAPAFAAAPSPGPARPTPLTKPAAAHPSPAVAAPAAAPAARPATPATAATSDSDWETF